MVKHHWDGVILDSQTRTPALKGSSVNQLATIKLCLGLRGIWLLQVLAKYISLDWDLRIVVASLNISNLAKTTSAPERLLAWHLSQGNV